MKENLYGNIYLQDGSVYMNKDGLTLGSSTYSWEELGVKMTDCLVLSYSNKDKIIKVNGNEINYKNSANYLIKSDYLFAYYYSDYDDGLLREWKGVPPDGSKLYYVKIWDENNNLIYLGAASKSFNQNTNQEENCWKSQIDDNYLNYFARYSTTLDNRQPYGGGID